MTASPLAVGGVVSLVTEATGSDCAGGSCWRLLSASIACVGEEIHLGGGPPGRAGGGRNAGLRGSRLNGFSPSVEALGVAFFLVHGSASYTRWCNDAVNPLVGDVIGVTVVLVVAVLLRDLER